MMKRLKLGQTERMIKMVEFISYTGKWPNRCNGVLTLKIDGEEITFGYNKNCLYPKFWLSGGCCGFVGGDYSKPYVEQGEWKIVFDELPDEFKKYIKEIEKIMNENIPQGCCGGCL